jgi:hypothetical protein
MATNLLSLPHRVAPIALLSVGRRHKRHRPRGRSSGCPCRLATRCHNWIAKNWVFFVKTDDPVFVPLRRGSPSPSPGQRPGKPSDIKDSVGPTAQLFSLEKANYWPNTRQTDATRAGSITRALPFAGRRDGPLALANSISDPALFPIRHYFLSAAKTEMKAFWGIWTWPTCFMRALPFFCLSRSLRLRETSPP